MTHSRYEVCIVGAGPAGCAAALELAGRGVRVALLDRAHFPRDKVCGDGIGPRAVRILEGLGVYSATAFSAYQRLDGVTLTSPGRHMIKVPLREDPEVGPGYVIPRITFDHMLVRQAIDRGALLLESFQVQDLIKRRYATEIVGLQGTHSSRIKADLVIGAWGSQTGLGRKWSRRSGVLRRSATAMRAYFEGLKGLEPFMAIHFDPDLVPGYGWVFPTGPDTANVGYGMRADHLRRAGVPLRDLYQRFIHTNPFVKEILSGARQAGPLRGAMIPFRRWGDHVAGDRLLLSGDAAGFADPLTGEGIGNALLSGQRAGQSAAEALAAGNLNRKGLASYHEECRRLLNKDLACAALLQGLLVNPPFASSKKVIDAFVLKASRNPRMARAMARLIIGDLPRDIILKGELWKKLWRAWTG